VARAGQAERLVVVDLAEAQAAVGLGHLHAERAELLEPVDHLGRDARLSLDAQRVDVLDEEGAQALEEGLALLDGRGIGGRLRMDQVEAEVAEEELLAEARELPVLLPSLLGHLARLALGDVDGHCWKVPLG